MVTTVYAITLFGSSSGFFEAYFGSTYFSMMTSDSYRYFYEAQLFSGKSIFVNEVEGGFLSYEATPKFGLSVLLSLFNPLSLKYAYEFYFAALCLVTLICSLINVRLLESALRGYKISDLLFYSFVFILLLFPTDIYWVSRFLREGLANSLLLMSMLSLYCYLRFGIKYLLIFLVSTTFLIFIRPQLIFILMVFFLIAAYFFKKIEPKVSFLMAALLLGAISQTIQVAGLNFFSRVLGVYNAEFLVYPLSSFNQISLLNYLLWIIVLVCVPLVFVTKSRHKDRSPKFGFFVPFVTLSLCCLFLMQSDLQIRFNYPLFIFAKFLLVFWFVQRYQTRSRVIRKMPLARHA